MQPAKVGGPVCKTGIIAIRVSAILSILINSIPTERILPQSIVAITKRDKATFMAPQPSGKAGGFEPLIRTFDPCWGCFLLRISSIGRVPGSEPGCCRFKSCIRCHCITTKMFVFVANHVVKLSTKNTYIFQCFWFIH